MMYLIVSINQRTLLLDYYGLFPNTESDPSPADAMGFIMDLPVSKLINALSSLSSRFSQ